MPEGHTIHRLARDHQKFFSGQKLIITSPQGRFESEAKKLSGKRLQSVEAHGKHLFYNFAGRSKSSPTRVHVHLGLYGKFRLHKNPAPEPRGAVRVRMIGEVGTRETARMREFFYKNHVPHTFFAASSDEGKNDASSPISDLS